MCVCIFHQAIGVRTTVGPDCDRFHRIWSTLSAAITGRIGTRRLFLTIHVATGSGRGHSVGAREIYEFIAGVIVAAAPR